MSLQQFQQALAAMTIDPRLAAAVRHEGLPALAHYTLTSLEQERLVSVSRQPGMALNCTLARGNRFGPIFDVYPMTCTLLTPWLRELLDTFWHGHHPGNYQLSGEEDAFAAFLRDRLASGAFVHPLLEEVLDYETACWQLIQASRHHGAMPAQGTAESFRHVRFRHDPGALLAPLAEGRAPDPEPALHACRVRVGLRAGTIVAEMEADAA